MATHRPGLEDEPYLGVIGNEIVAGAAGTTERDIVLGLQQDGLRVATVARAIVDAEAVRLQEQATPPTEEPSALEEL